MSKLSTQPTNFNNLSIQNYRFLLKRAPTLVYNAQRANLPGISMSDTTYATQLKNIPIAGDELDFEPLIISFLVDEDMKNYMEIWNWIVALGFPKDYNQFGRLREKATNISGEGVYSDATLTLLTNKKNANVDVEFHDIFPFSISGLDFDITSESATPVEATVSFYYQKYEFTQL